MHDTLPPPGHRRESFLVGDYLVEPFLQRVSSGDQVTQVEPKVMDVLLLLVAHHERPVSKQEFLDVVWEGTVVTDDALLRCISELRKVFNDDPRDPTYIETIRKRGYRLIAPLREVTDAASDESTTDVSESESDWWKIWFAVAATAVAMLVLIWLLQPHSESAPTRPLRAIPLTSYPGEELDPALSPRGGRLAFVWDGGEGAGRDIYITQAGAPSPVRFTTDAADDFSPAWMPDGERVLFIRRDSLQFRVFVKPVTSGAERELATVRARDVFDAALSPDGRHLAVSAQNDGPYRISILDLVSGERTVLPPPPSDYLGDRHLTYSPDGEELAFVRSVMEKVDDVFVFRMRDGRLRRITSDYAEIAGIDWSPDGAQLFFSSNREGASTVWRVEAEGGTPVWMPISIEGSGVRQLATSRLSRHLAAVIRSEETNIWSMSIEPTRAALDVEGTGRSAAHPLRVPVLASTRMDEEPQVSPDNRRLAFISNRLGNYEVWISNRDESNPIQLTELGGPFTSTPRWNPDGDRIAFAARWQGQIDVYIVDVAGGRTERLTTAGSNDRQPQWSRDGNWVYFASNRTGDWEIWKRPVAGGDPVQVTMNGGFSAMESVDRQWLYFVKRHMPGIWRIPLEGGEEELIVEHVEAYDWGNWMVDRGGLYFVDRRDHPIRIVRLSDSDAPPEVIAELEVLPKEPALSIEPGGGAIVYTQLDQRGSDIVLVENF